MILMQGKGVSKGVVKGPIYFYQRGAVTVSTAKAADLEAEKRRLEEENEALRKELEILREKTLKERLYDHVHVSVRTMDIFIGVMAALFIAVIVLGLLNK